LSSAFHCGTILCLALVGNAAALGLLYWSGFLMVTAILVWEHRIVRPDDLSRINKAFFDLNAYVSLGYFLFTLADILLISNTRLSG
jgi:4-hydroxybenzoate polyprenyltransferase